MISKKNVPEKRASRNQKSARAEIQKSARAEIRKAREPKPEKRTSLKKKNLDFSTFAG